MRKKRRQNGIMDKLTKAHLLLDQEKPFYISKILLTSCLEKMSNPYNIFNKCKKNLLVFGSGDLASRSTQEPKSRFQKKYTVVNRETESHIVKLFNFVVAN